MNLLLVSSYSPFHEVTGNIEGGAEIAMRRIGEHLAARDHNVSYLTFDENVETRTTLNGVQVCVRDRKLASDRTGSGFEQFVKGRIRSTSQYFATRQRGPRREFSIEILQSIERRLQDYCWNFKRFVAKEVKENKIEVIHCFSSLPDALACAAVANKYRIPLVIRMGGRYWYLKYHSIKDPGKRAMYLDQLKYVFRVVSCLAFNAAPLRAETKLMFRELGINTTQNQPLIDIGVDFPKASAGESEAVQRVRSELTGGAFTAFSVGKFKENSKRQDLLIEAVKRLEGRVPLKVIFAGNGGTLPKMQEYAKKLGVADRIIFLGSVAHEDVFEIIKMCDVFVHPTEFEGSSKAVAEAMLCERPIVASKIPPLREHIEHGVNGVLAENTAKGFEKALLRVYDSEEFRRSLARNAKAYADEHFNPGQNAVKYEELFSTLIEHNQIGRQISVNPQMSC